MISTLEIIGIVASVLIVMAMLFKTTTFKGTICMRIINLIGSIVFVVYGIMLPSICITIANGGSVLINAFFIFKETYDHNKCITK